MARSDQLFVALFISLSLMASWGSAVQDAPQRHRRAASEQLQVDNLLDNLLLTVQRVMAKGGVVVEMLPDVSLRSGQLSLTGTQGIIKGLTTLYRSDTAFMEYGNGSVILKTSFSLQSLEISYLVQAKYLFLSMTNDASATVTYNSVKLRAGIFWNGDECYVGLEDVSVDMLQGIQWRTSGFGTINALVSTAINRLVPAETIKANLNIALKRATSGFKLPCQNFIPGVNRDLKWGC